ncbi:hypothetical protein F8M41_019127 [Gigaspora margarita]|uniref:DNA-directed DNA polymerase n=1 Tax=Gigaspora margarita TaxID=4874 RepID=A0A8H4EKV9_GIGMA|nr:hypothetical protein F8M41_019127 [Gigaspora margarita]
MYSNTIIEKNISNDTFVDIDSIDPNLNMVEDNGKIYSKFIREKIGLIPLMHKQLLQDRQIAKDKIKYYKEIKPNSVLLLYWTSLSNALKLLANSIYSVTGDIFSNLYNLLIAPLVIAYSHLILQKVIKFAEQNAKVINSISIALKTLQYINKNINHNAKLDQRYQQQ